MTPPQTIDIHGQPVTFHMMGEGPPILLIHGITSSSRTWKRVMPRLAETHTVIAPDLLGHGRSAKPPGDYSLGAYASGIRDLLVALDIPRSTVVGHSLGGGIAMQFAYQVPERVGRLALVSSGGIGREVNPMLKAAALPGALSRRLDECLGHMRTGTPMAEALEALAAQAQVPSLTRLADAVAQAHSRGTPLTEVVRAQAADARADERRRLLETAGRKDVAMLVPIVFLVLPTVIVIAIFPGLSALEVVVP